MVRSTSILGLSRDLWYKLGGILLVALVIAAIAYSLASASQAAVPPTAETFASATDKKCAANEADSHGCYPGKGEGWCAARGACINRMDAGLADDKAFAKQCALDDTTTAAAASTASTTTVTEVDTTVTTKAVETDTAVAETTSATESERTDATGGACCLGDNGKAADDKKPAAKCPASAPTAPASDCATCGEAPPNNCPKPVYCPPCPKCPPPCPRMCPDLSKYVLKTSIPPCPEAQVDLTKYMLRSECKQPDMSKYVLKTSVPSFKCPLCPPCICKCDGSAYDPATDGDGHVTREEADGSADGSSSTDAVAAEEALGGNRNTSQSSADFDSADLTGTSVGASSGGTGGGSGGGYGSGSSGYGIGSNGGGFGSLGGSAFGFGGGLFGRSSNGAGGVGANSAGADFEGACAASDNDAYNGSYSVQPVIQD